MRRLLAPLIAGSVLTWQRGGGGQRLVVRDQARFDEFIATTYPHSAEELGACPSARVSAVARYRDSKALANDVREIVNVRAWSDEGLRCDGNPMLVTAHTARYGVFSFLLEGDNRYTLHEPCALVENPAVFTAFEQLALPTKIVFFGRGRISERLLNWFGRQTDVGFALFHLPDYDPVGLNEFERLRARLGNRVQLHTPDDLQQRFIRFGNRNLLAKPNSRAMLAKLRRSKSSEVHRVVELIDRNNAGLEQEALLL
ncbi:MAG: hypothetical protein ACLQU3_21110 [Limisphaerales bacterium]